MVLENVWSFLLQTISVSIVAAILLIIKRILNKRLLPAWQYGVWSVLTLRILLPAELSTSVFPKIPLWLETIKTTVEQGHNSVFTAVYAPIAVKLPIPLIRATPQSMTDWVFIIYVAGVVFFLLRYLFSYIYLRFLLRKSADAPSEIQAQVLEVSRKFGLPNCRITSVSGLSSAFICGFLRPVLAVPDGEKLDDKVILHELLHLKYLDALQSMFFCVLRALHWCNPFLQYVFNCIGNDMESLCDQRVLERLEGEERREYGNILLDMANDNYPRAFGTTSISNGGRNIALRIAAIANFKRYPRGMSLVSVCIVIALSSLITSGAGAAFSLRDYEPRNASELEMSMALSRINRCTTVVGALDSYAKGLLFQNGVYIASASPLSEQESIIAEMLDNAQQGEPFYHLSNSATEFFIIQSDGYNILNLTKTAENEYEASLIFTATSFWDKDANDFLKDEFGEAYRSGCCLLPVTVRYEDAWVVIPRDEVQTFPGVTTHETIYRESGIPPLEYHVKTGDTGTVSIFMSAIYTVENAAESNNSMGFGGSAINRMIDTDAQLSYGQLHCGTEYVFGGSEEEYAALESIALVQVEITDFEKAPIFPYSISEYSDSSNSSWGSNDGSSGARKTLNSSAAEAPNMKTNATLIAGSGSGGSIEDFDLYEAAKGYAVQIYWNDEPVEVFIFGEEGR